MGDLSSIPVFILAGGLGTRLSEETDLRPKPMVEIGDTPILLHIMRWYYSFGFNDFVICAGYRSWDIKDYFLTYHYRRNHVSIDHRNGEQHAPSCDATDLINERWRVRVIDTGLNTMTGGRLARALRFVGASQNITHFAVTYGDGLADVNLRDEFNFHEAHGRLGTMIGVPPVSRFGELAHDDGGLIHSFIEKPENKHGLINGGFFFFRSAFADRLIDDPTLVLERKPLEEAARDKQLMMFEHRGFWQCMDTLRDKLQLQKIWDDGRAPWRPQNRGM